MASSTALTWSSSSLLQSFGATTTKAPESRSSSSNSTVMKVVCQRKVKKIRQVGLSSQIIMKENVDKVGKKGELVNVRAGFFRNFLLPLGKASMVTPAVLKEMKMEQDRIEAEKKRVKEEAQQLASVFESIGSFKVKRKSGGKGKQIFGSVTTQDLVDIIKAQLQRDIDKKIVSLPEIRETGEYIAELKLHPDVTARIRLSVYAN